MFNKFLIKVLKRTINKLETKNKFLKEKVNLLEDKNQDLENNIEFLVNNLTPKKRASLGLDNQN